MQVIQQQFTARQYLQMDISAQFGLDKESWESRLDWFNNHEEVLEGMANQAEAPAQYYAAVLAWRNVQKNEPIGYGIALDATASGK